METEGPLVFPRYPKKSNSICWLRDAWPALLPILLSS